MNSIRKNLLIIVKAELYVANNFFGNYFRLKRFKVVSEEKFKFWKKLMIKRILLLDKNKFLIFIIKRFLIIPKKKYFQISFVLCNFCCDSEHT